MRSVHLFTVLDIKFKINQDTVFEFARYSETIRYDEISTFQFVKSDQIA